MLAARCILLNLPQQEKLNRSDMAVMDAIFHAIKTGQIDECEVTGMPVGAGQYLLPVAPINMPKLEDYGVPTHNTRRTMDNKNKSEAVKMMIAIIAMIVTVIAMILILN